MAKKIGWEELGFDFNDDSPLDKVAAGLQKVIDTSNEMTRILVENNKKIVAEQKALKGQAEKTAESIKKINVEAGNSSKQLSEAAKETDHLTTSIGTLNTIEAENTKQVTKLKDEVTTLTKAKSKLKDLQKQEVGSLNELKQNLANAEKAYREMGSAAKADDKEKQRKQVEALSREYNSANRILSDAKKANTAISGSYQELTQRVAAAKKELKEMAGAFDKNNPKVKALTKYVKEGSDKLKGFDKAIGDNQREVGNYGLALQGLSLASSAAGSSVTQLTSSLKLLASNPWILAAAALVGTFVALKDAAQSYYTATLAGEEAFKRSEAFNDAIFSSYRAKWIELGEVVANYWERFKIGAAELGKTFQTTAQIEAINQALRDKLFIEEDRANLAKEHQRDLVDDAHTELEVNKLLEISKDKINFKAKERIAALLEGNKLLRKQEDGDIELAQQDLRLQKDIIAQQSNANKGKFDYTKNFLELTNQEILEIGVRGEEIQKWAQLEAALVKVESDASSKRVSRLKQQISLIKEINDENKKAADDLTKMQRAVIDSKLIQQPFIDQLGALSEDATKKLNDEIAKQFELRHKGLDAMLVARQNFEDKIDQIEADRTKKTEMLEQARLALKDQAIQTALALTNDYFAYQDKQLQQQTNELEASRAKELTAAGDNADAKAAIEASYAEQLNTIQQEQRKNKRQQAIFDKAFAAFQVVINTSRAIAEAVAASPLTGGLPFSAIATAIGALQLATVLSAPLPAFSEGGEMEHTGLAVIAEKGRELTYNPATREARLYDTPGATIAEIAGGTRIYNNDETERILEGEDFEKMGIAIQTGKGLSKRSRGGNTVVVVKDDDRILAELRNNRPPNYFKAASDIYEAKKEGDGMSIRIRKMSLR